MLTPGLSQSPVFKGAALAVLAAFLFSCLNVVIRFSDPFLTVWHMIFGRSLFGMVFLFFMARSLGIGLAGQNRWVLILLGCTGTAGIIFLTVALLRIPLFQALILFYTYPVVAALISPFLTPDTNTVRDWICIAAAFVGTGLTLWSGSHMGVELDVGHLAGLGASLFMGLTLTLVRRVSAVNSPLTPIFYISAVGMLASFFPMLHPDVGIVVPVQGLAWIMAIGLFAVLAHIATNKALSFISSAKVGSIGMLEVIFGAVYGYVLFSEALGWSTLVGGAFIIAASVGLAQGGGRIPAVKE
ncbi:MAG: DMT family transporter [Desulfovermiculus sp.]|nr:DMT family transporter [Desulfovermiculus sp.]